MVGRTPSAILESWNGISPPSLGELGGESGVLADASILAAGPHFSVVVAAIVGDWGSVQDRPGLAKFIVAGLLSNEHLLQIKTTVDELLAAEQALGDLAGELMPAFMTRASQRRSSRDAAIAAAALEGGLRLVLGGWSDARLSVASLLANVTADEDDLFAIPATRLIGTAYEQWRFGELKGSLDRLSRTSGATQDARHELAAARLVDALDADDESELVAGLEEAAVMFSAAGREDSTILALAARAVAKVGSASAEDLADVRAELDRRVRMHQMGLHGAHRSWLAPRADAEIAWLRLVDTLSIVAVGSQGSSAEAAGDLLHAFASTRAVHLLMRADERTAVNVILDPVIGSSLLEQAELTSAVIRAIESLPADDPERPAAEQLLALALSGKKNGMTGCWRSTQS